VTSDVYYLHACVIYRYEYIELGIKFVNQSNCTLLLTLVLHEYTYTKLTPTSMNEIYIIRVNQKYQPHI